MSGNVVNQSPFLRTTRNFPEDPQALSVEINKSYLDIAGFVNDRTIGLFPTNRPANTGNSYFISNNQKQQSLRQIYTFSDANLTQSHGLNLTGIVYFSAIYGTFFDGTYWQTLPYVDTSAANNQISIKVSSTQIIVTKGAGAPPSCSNGIIVLEWVSNP